MNEPDKVQEKILIGRLETAITNYKEFECELVQLFISKWPEHKMVFMKVAMDAGLEAKNL